MLDYGHNAAALAAMGRLLHDAWPGDPVAAVILPGDRRDDLVAKAAATVAAWFGRVVVYEDADLRGRCPGEMIRLITAGLRQGRPSVTIVTAPGPTEALRSALALTSGPADPVLFVCEKLEPVLALLGSPGAMPSPPPGR